jgi:hypothetical protein
MLGKKMKLYQGLCDTMREIYQENKRLMKGLAVTCIASAAIITYSLGYLHGRKDTVNEVIKEIRSPIQKLDDLRQYEQELDDAADKVRKQLNDEPKSKPRQPRLRIRRNYCLPC